MTTPAAGGVRRRLDFSVAQRRTFELARPYGGLLAAAAVPTIIQLISAVLLAFVGLPRLRVGFYAGTFSALFVLVPAIVVGGGVLAGLASTQAGAAIAARATAAAEGRPLGLWAALAETRGVFIRVLPAWLLLGALQWIAFAVVGWTLEATRRAAISDTDAAGAFVLLLLFIVFMLLVAWVVSIVLQVRLFLFMPAATLERLEGFTALKRSWQLTRGVGGLIFGALVLVGLIGFVVGSIFAPFALATLNPDIPYSDPSDPSVFTPTALAMAAGQLLTLITSPLLWLFSIVIYRFQVGLELPPPPAWTAGYAYPPPPPPGFGYLGGAVPPSPPPSGYPPPPPPAPRLC